MKALRTRIMSAFLVIMTLLTLLPTSALAASGTGTGIKPTDNTNYWTTRLLHDGTPYSYKPPMAAGKLLYCLDRGYGYRWGTASFLNSYTYTSATGADADKRVRKKESALFLASQNLEDFTQPGIRELTRPLFSIPVHQFIFNGGNVDKKFFMDNLQLEESEYALIRDPQRGSCLYKCGNERYLLQVQAPEYKQALFGTAGGR